MGIDSFARMREGLRHCLSSFRFWGEKASAESLTLKLSEGRTSGARPNLPNTSFEHIFEYPKALNSIEKAHCLS